jgi:KDO2-lipid IV(A) lauroyltransferase
MTQLFFMLGWLPLGLLHPIGTALGWLAYALSPGYRQRMRQHTQQAGLSTAQRRAAIGHAGKMVAELPRIWGKPHGALLGTRVQWQGTEDMADAVAQGRGIVLLTLHLGCFEMVGQAYAERFGAIQPLNALYRPAKQRWFAHIMVHARQRPGMTASPATLSGVRQLLRSLKRGETVALLPDQVPPQGLGVWVPFFARPAYTMTMAAKLAAQTGAAVVLVHCERLGFWQRYRRKADFLVHAKRVSAEVEAVLHGQDLAASTALINRLMEAIIMQCPEQYLWAYNRYKQPRAEMHTATPAGDKA